MWCVAARSSALCSAEEIFGIKQMSWVALIQTLSVSQLRLKLNRRKYEWCGFSHEEAREFPRATEWVTRSNRRWCIYLWADTCSFPRTTMWILRVFNHHSSAPKNEDAYEISIPFEDNNFEQQGGFYNQNDQNFDGQYNWFITSFCCNLCPNALIHYVLTHSQCSVWFHKVFLSFNIRVW